MSLLTSLNSYYPFDNSPADVTGTNTSTAAGSPTYPTGKINQGLSNGGNNGNYVSSPVNIGGGSWSFSGWLYRTGAVTTYAASFCVNASNFTGLYLNPSNLVSIYGAGDIRPGTGSVPLNTWTHVVVTYDGTTVLFYVNGVAAGSWTGTVGGGTTFVNSFAANNSIWGAFPGLVDEFGFWARVLTSTEASTLYNSGAGLAYPFSAAAPTVSSVTPSSGPAGTPITIAGTGFVTGATVTIGGAAATSVVFGSSTSLTAVAPVHAPGVADVVVTNPDTQTGTLVGGYTFAALPPVFTTYGTQLANLLPPGRLWNLEGESHLRRELLATGDEFARVAARGAALIEETDPRTATETLADWESALALPDEQVIAIPGTTAGRRVAITQKLVGRTGQTFDDYAAWGAACGYPLISITKYAATVARSGRARSGADRSGSTWAYAITITVSPATAGALSRADFERVIRHATHAHITVVFIYT